MPIYCYECPYCGFRTEELRPVAQRNRLPQCPQCGSDPGATLMERSLQAEAIHTPLQNFREPIEMFSIAPTNGDEELELRRAVPEAEWDETLKVPRARNRKEKLDLLKACGYVEAS